MPEQDKKPDASDSFWITSSYRPQQRRGDIFDTLAGWWRRQSDHEARRSKEVKEVSNVQLKQMLGFLGSILLFLGVFMPIVSAPIIGSLNYFQNGRGDGVIVLVLAVISVWLTLSRNYRWLWFTGLGSLGVLLFTFVNFQVRLSQVSAELDQELAGNPFKALGDLAMQSVQLQWGWAVLFVGAVLVIGAAAMREDAGV